MATRSDILQHDARIRRWWWLALAVAVLLGAYVGGVNWATRTVGAGIQASIQPLPALTRERPDQN